MCQVQFAKSDPNEYKKRQEERRMKVVPTCCLFVVGYDPKTTKPHYLEYEFERVSKVQRVEMLQKFSYVHFNSITDAKKVLEHFDGKVCSWSPPAVSIACACINLQVPCIRNYLEGSWPLNIELPVPRMITTFLAVVMIPGIGIMMIVVEGFMIALIDPLLGIVVDQGMIDIEVIRIIQQHTHLIIHVVVMVMEYEFHLKSI